MIENQTSSSKISLALKENIRKRYPSLKCHRGSERWVVDVRTSFQLNILLSKYNYENEFPLLREDWLVWDPP